MTKYLTTVTHSHGTLRSEDLAECFADLLESMNHDDAALIADLRAICERGEDPTDAEVIDEAIDALQQYCLPFCYFGTNEGDGSDFGVWFSGARFEDACDCGEVIRVSDLPKSTPCRAKTWRAQSMSQSLMITGTCRFILLS